jgi:quercetin dioxygenase-like cupin family protein
MLVRNLNRLLIATILACSVSALAGEITPSPVRTILERHDQSGVAGKEIVLGSASLPPGSAIGFHIHPGDEAGYVLRGTLILKVKGQPDRVLKPGDSFFNARGLVHSVVALPGGEGGVALSTWIVDKDQPLASPMPQ